MNLSHRVVLAGTLLALAGCKQSMIQQKKYGFDAPSRIWREGT